MLSTPFLTDIDVRARIRGSRDPLGTQSSWARLGRQVVGNLTTVTTSVRQFTTLLLGYYFAERAAEQHPDSDDLGVFLRWEQLAAYARWGVNRDPDIRGIDRVKRNLAESVVVRLGTDASAQILSNQKTYGLWGLYSVAARSSGLLDGEPTRVTPPARELIERCCLPVFTKGGCPRGDRIVDLLQRQRASLDTAGRDRELVGAVARVLQPRIGSTEREILHKHLTDGGPHDTTEGKQAALARAFESLPEDVALGLSPRQTQMIAKQCRAQGGPGIDAASGLDRIRAAESFLAPASALFGLLLWSERQSLDQIATVVRRAWGRELRTIDVDAIGQLEVELSAAAGDAATGARWIDLARHLAAGRYELAIELLIEQNRTVMKGRDGVAPWVDLRNGRVAVRYREEYGTAFPEGDELRDFWVHSYFLDSLYHVARALRPENARARAGRPGS